jgi:hypothetical protein
VQSPKAYLSTIVVRLCINQAESARAQREVYVGSWLPEPILTSHRPEMQTRIEEVNGNPAIIGYLDGHPCGVLMCEIEGERIRQIYAVVNPEKLHWLGKQSV